MEKLLGFKGYTANVKYNEEDGVYHGKIEGIKDLINFEGNTLDGAELEFQLAVIDYLLYCQDLGVEPDKPSTDEETTDVVNNLTISNTFVRSIIERFGDESQSIVMIEEMAELQKELTKFLRGKGDFDHLCEEISHVYISLEMIMSVHGVTKNDIQAKIDEKIKEYTNNQKEQGD